MKALSEYINESTAEIEAELGQLYCKFPYCAERNKMGDGDVWKKYKRFIDCLENYTSFVFDWKCPNLLKGKNLDCIRLVYLYGYRRAQSPGESDTTKVIFGIDFLKKDKVMDSYSSYFSGEDRDAIRVLTDIEMFANAISDNEKSFDKFIKELKRLSDSDGNFDLYELKNKVK